ncbi:MAG: hypothetical protein QOF49_2163, partial [Chloroflexota bacterium]|nr:hypothetical protein [Chloroflexota bacterium]
HRTVAPILAARGWSGVFFVTARRPGERLSVGHAIHVLLAKFTADELRAAVADRLDDADRLRLGAVERRELAAGVRPIDALKRPLQRELADVAGPVLSCLIDEHVGPEPDVADALHLTPNAVADLRRSGMTIGGHGRRHVWFDCTPAETVRSEIAASTAFLAGDPRPWPFAYPYGASGEGSDRALAAAGFGAAFHASPTRPTGLYDLGRVDAEDGLPDGILAGAR